MSKILYFVTTLLESGLSVFGIRGGYEQPTYQVLQTLPPGVEIRAYAPRTAVETPVKDGNQGEAFGKLFRYITGANQAQATIAMSTPVERSSRLIAMTVPVEMSGGPTTMRFFLPGAVVAAGAPIPTEPDVRIVALPATTLGVIRYAGTATDSARSRELSDLRAKLAGAGKTPEGAPLYLSYDPPFAIPFLRRNEVALQITP